MTTATTSRFTSSYGHSTQNVTPGRSTQNVTPGRSTQRFVRAVLAVFLVLSVIAGTVAFVLVPDLVWDVLAVASAVGMIGLAVGLAIRGTGA